MSKQTFPHTNYDCGCQFVPRDDGWAIWTMCPLHEAAPDLLAACKAFMSGPPAGVVGKMRAAIAKAEPDA